MKHVIITKRFTGAVLFETEAESLTLFQREALSRIDGLVEVVGDCWTVAIGLVHGHARISIGDQRQYLHRTLWEIVNGKVPDGFLVRHSCDTRNCINPSHLLIGTNADNMRDMAARGRSTRGRKLTAEHRAKVSAAQIGRKHSAETKAKIAASVCASRDLREQAALQAQS